MTDEFTTRDKQREAEREVTMRERVYPRFVGRGKLSQADADRQIALMRSIAEDYRRAADAAEAQGKLI